MTRAFVIAFATGLALQIAMVVAGHFVPAIRTYGFAIGGMAISLLAGAILARLSDSGLGAELLGGALAGGACALGGIAVSYLLKDVPLSLLALGTLSSAATGAIGAAASR